MAQVRPPAGWQPTHDGGYRNPASGTVIYPDGRGGWTGTSVGGTAQPAAPANLGGGGVATTGPHSLAGHVAPPVVTLRDAGSGTPDPVIAQHERSKIYSMSPRQRQLYLRSMGYNVKVDGKSGPQTAAAAWSFVSGKDSRFFNNQGRDWQQSIWNKYFAKYHPADASVSATPPKATTQTTPADKNNHSAAPQPSNAQYSDSIPTNLSDSISSGLGDLDALAGSGTLIDAKKALQIGTLLNATQAGNAAVENGFGQSMRDNARLVANLPNQAAGHQEDLKNWYAQVLNTLKVGSARDASAANDAISSSEGATGAIASALGDNANGGLYDVTSAGNNGTAALRALQLAGSIGSTDLAAAIAAQGVGARANQRLTDQSDLNDAINQGNDLRAQAGAARTTAVQSAQQANNSLSEARLSDYAGLVGQNNSLVNDRAQRVAASLAAKEAAAELPIDVSYKASQTAANNAGALKAIQTAHAAMTKLPRGAFDATDAKTKGSVADAAVTAAHTIIQNKGSVEQAVQAVNNLYRSRGWSLRNPRVVKAIMASLRGAGIKVDPHWWAKFGYTGG